MKKSTLPILATTALFLVGCDQGSVQDQGARDGIAEIVIEETTLPDDFIADRYLDLNPDVKAAGVDAGYHYLNYGISEGRVYK